MHQGMERVLGFAARIRVVVFRLPILILAIVVLAVAAAGAFHTPALAQEQPQNRGWSLRDFVPASQRAHRAAVDIQKAKPKAKENRMFQRAAVPVVEKTPDARVVLVVGDFMAGGLAEGLDTAFADNANVRIVERANGSWLCAR